MIKLEYIRGQGEELEKTFIEGALNLEVSEKIVVHFPDDLAKRDFVRPFLEGALPHVKKYVHEINELSNTYTLRRLK